MTSKGNSPTTDALIDLLRDDRLQDHVVMRARDRRNVKVQEALALARQDFGDVDDLELSLDAAAKVAGGDRFEMVDPGRWVPDLVKRLAGKERAPRDDYYSLPRR